MAGEREILQAKARERGLAFVDLERTPIDPAAVASVPGNLARTHEAMPVKRLDTQLWVAMATPNSLRAIDELGQASGCRIIPVMAVPEAIALAIREHYGESPI